jgi:hypothetical protein
MSSYYVDKSDRGGILAYFVHGFSKTIGQASVTYGTRAKRGTRNDFRWHTEWIEIQ